MRAVTKHKELLCSSAECSRQEPGRTLEPFTELNWYAKMAALVPVTKSCLPAQAANPMPAEESTGAQPPTHEYSHANSTMIASPYTPSKKQMQEKNHRRIWCMLQRESSMFKRLL